MSPDCEDSLNTSGHKKSLSEDSSARAARLRRADQFERQLSNVGRPSKPSLQDSFNSRVSDQQDVAVTINEPIQFYEVDDEAAEDQ